MYLHGYASRIEIPAAGPGRVTIQAGTRYQAIERTRTVQSREVERKKGDALRAAACAGQLILLKLHKILVQFAEIT